MKTKVIIAVVVCCLLGGGVITIRVIQQQREAAAERRAERRAERYRDLDREMYALVEEFKDPLSQLRSDVYQLVREKENKAPFWKWEVEDYQESIQAHKQELEEKQQEFQAFVNQHPDFIASRTDFHRKMVDQLVKMDTDELISTWKKKYRKEKELDG